MSTEDLLLGVALVAAGAAMVWRSLVVDTYDDRLEDRPRDRLRQVGWSSSPLPMTLVRRIAGSLFGLLIAGAGVWWLLRDHGG